MSQIKLERFNAKSYENKMMQRYDNSETKEYQRHMDC